MDELDFIAALRPLATSPVARGLLDDVAVVPSRPGYDLVLTKDAIVEGVHFLPDDPLDLVARKLLRVNLSDLAAKGAEPYGYLLAVAWPARRVAAERTAFVEGLRVDQAAYGLALLGGDTVSTPGSLTASATLLGWVPSGETIGRIGARPGDLLYVSGPIGDGWLGLKAARGKLDSPRLAARYRLPEPRTDLASKLRVLASASADVSDGLLADAAHIAEASGVAIRVELDAVPLSAEGRVWGDVLALATGGDDYEVVFTCPPARAEEAARFGIRIGDVVAGRGVSATLHGAPVALDRLGWRHG